MLRSLDVSYESAEIEALVSIRDTIIHTGLPPGTNMKDHQVNIKIVTRARGLVERAMLKLAGWNGPARFEDEITCFYFEDDAESSSI